ncbi:FadR family transcriptional regulator [Catenulispora sp. NF23]|uniref:FadR family transcriptional regulator n=1 Tax=Catenulispora pinistramenti TaxID=2705254 RepID=A0ABS5KKN1_9ACTN|nr:FadR/GntR family transcriptional regulator [Catenulispora pinistramenti]MBS2533393.1 FadR family transcriptional regulator [Catenulispora pinistramenti]MBS2546591.1 FadR family transcriptional regulator [Catenulispora pinistramenti]
MANGLTGIQRGSLVDEVIDKLREQISSGAWPVDARIPTEPELVEALNVGRGTVREAVRALAHAGLLEVRRGDGTYVRARSELSGALRREIQATTHDHVQEVRRAIEVEAARLAAGRADAADLDACSDALAARDVAARKVEKASPGDTSWVDEWVEADAHFHTAMVAAAGNPLLLDLYLEIGSALRTVLYDRALRTDFDRFLVAGHSTLLDAVRAGDPEAAVREASLNVETSAEE